MTDRPDIAAIEARLKAYVSVIDEYNARRPRTTYDDVIHGFNDHELRRSDIAALLEYVKTLEADRCHPYGGVSYA